MAKRLNKAEKEWIKSRSWYIENKSISDCLDLNANNHKITLPIVLQLIEGTHALLSEAANSRETLGEDDIIIFEKNVTRLRDVVDFRIPAHNYLIAKLENKRYANKNIQEIIKP